MAAFKPAYLLHGDDHGRLSERRARLRAVAEQQGGANGVEIFEGERATPAEVSAALSTMTFAMGRRFIVVDGVERWKDKELDDLAQLLADPPPETTVAFFAREEGRTKAPPRLHEIVRAAGGEIAAEQAVKPWELPEWAAKQARGMGIELDRNAARALVNHVGGRQQRLLRELERLLLELGPGARLDADEVEELTALSAERKVWAIADALLTRSPSAVVRAYLELRAQGERLPSLQYWMVRRVRLAESVVTRLEAGEPPGKIRPTLGMPPKAADKFIADARRADRDQLRQALETLADLELQSRRGGTELEEDTVAIRALLALVD